MARLKCKGMTFSVDKVGTGTTFTKIPQVHSISGPSKSVGTIDDTDLDSVAEEMSPGLTASGEIAVEMRFDPANTDHAYLDTWTDAPTIKKVQVSVPTSPATLYTVDAFPVGLDRPGGANQDAYMATFTLQATGPWVKTTATP
ncbi:phage tail tube protein [Paludisphaera soli]|uniref:phage tail tube protein n=1 Tax=Paludisphaera soli TaxID=2712865 RepID=UPI0013E9E0B8|nr:hypothetical protein [Paludisphaera soli]